MIRKSRESLPIIDYITVTLVIEMDQTYIIHSNNRQFNSVIEVIYW